VAVLLAGPKKNPAAHSANGVGVRLRKLPSSSSLARAAQAAAFSLSSVPWEE